MGDIAVGKRRLDGPGSAVGQQHAAFVELVALGVPAEVIVIVEYQNARRLAGVSPIEVGRRKPAEAAAHYHQVIAFASINGLACLDPKIAVTELVCHVERARVVASHAIASGWVITGRVLRQGCGFGPRESAEKRAGGNPAQSDGNAVQKIAARDAALHAQLFVAIGRHGSQFCVQCRMVTGDASIIPRRLRPANTADGLESAG